MRKGIKWTLIAMPQIFITSFCFSWNPFGFYQSYGYQPYHHHHTHRHAKRTHHNSLQTTELGADSDSLGGRILNTMDSVDKKKMYRALDKPLGKSSQWLNPTTGNTYTVVPLKKITINGNPFCRKYKATLEKNGIEKETIGAACVGSDSTWQSASMRAIDRPPSFDEETNRSNYREFIQPEVLNEE